MGERTRSRIGTREGVKTVRVYSANPKTADGYNTFIFRRAVARSLSKLAWAPVIDGSRNTIPEGIKIGDESVRYSADEKKRLVDFVERLANAQKGPVENDDFGRFEITKVFATEVQCHAISTRREIEAVSSAAEIARSMVHFVGSPNEELKRKKPNKYFEYGLAKIRLSDGVYLVMGEVGIRVNKRPYYDQRVVAKFKADSEVTSLHGQTQIGESAFERIYDNRFRLILQGVELYYKQSPKFSIIIPVYNVASYLRECLDSVLAQTYTDWEAICVDDGSTDGSGAILDEYAAKDNRFRVIHQANAGVSAARNAGLDEARGEWLEFIDADDSIMPEALSRFVSVVNKADVVFFGCTMTLRDGFRRTYILPDWTVSPVEESTATQISSLAFSALGDVFGWTWDKFIRRDVVERFHIRFNQAISFFEDELFALEVMNVAESFATLPDCLYQYRQTAGGLTAQGATDLDVLGETFMRVGTKLNNSGLRKIAFSRAQTWLRQSACRGFRLKPSRSLILLYRMASDVIGTDGSYNKLMCVLCRFPVCVAKFLLAGLHMFHK